MIDPRILKENPEQIKEMLAKRNMNIPIDDLFNLDKKRRHMTTELQTLYHKKNLMAKEIAKKRKNKEQTDIDIQKMSNISENIKELEDDSKANDERYKKLLSSIPNFFHNSVPIGKDQQDNKILNIFDGRIKRSSSILSTTEDNPDKGISNIKSIEKSNIENHKSNLIKNHIEIANELDLTLFPYTTLFRSKSVV